MKERSWEEILKKAMETWGYTQQALVACEEMGELAQTLSKWSRQGDYADFKKVKMMRNNIAAEIADVSIMLTQFSLFFGIEDDELEERIDGKLSMIAEKLFPEDYEDL